MGVQTRGQGRQGSNWSWATGAEHKSNANKIFTKPAQLSQLHDQFEPHARGFAPGSMDAEADAGHAK